MHVPEDLVGAADKAALWQDALRQEWREKGFVRAEVYALEGLCAIALLAAVLVVVTRVTHTHDEQQRGYAPGQSGVPFEREVSC